jgi:hypothetical protein
VDKLPAKAGTLDLGVLICYNGGIRTKWYKKKPENVVWREEFILSCKKNLVK